MENIVKVWEILPKLTNLFREEHRKRNMVAGHNFDHTLRCAQFAANIVDQEFALAAGAAGLCHNTDRLFQKDLDLHYNKDVPEDLVVNLNTRLLVESGEVPERWHQPILEAVKYHSGANRDDGNIILVALQDGDRLTCSDPGEIMEAVRYFHDLPAFDPVHLVNDPQATFRNPRSALRNMVDRDDWLTNPRFCVCLPKARALMQWRVDVIHQFIADITRSRAEIGLVPYPFNEAA